MNHSLVKTFTSNTLLFDIFSFTISTKWHCIVKKQFTYNYIMTINQASREELLRYTICRICPNVKWICISNHKIKINNPVQCKIHFFSLNKIIHGSFNSTIQILSEQKKSKVTGNIFSHMQFVSGYLKLLYEIIIFFTFELNKIFCPLATIWIDPHRHL